MANVLVIDGNSLLFRAYYATAYGDPSAIMSTKSGIPTNAIFAFSNMLAKLLSSLNEGDLIFIGFDKDGNTFRKQEFEAYKANRKPCPPELIKQFPISRELCKALNIVCYEEHGIEADDICGTVAKLASKEGMKVTVYTSDKDYLQLIDKNISVSLLKRGLSDMDLVTEANMKEKFGFSPLQIIDYKGLRGDASDNLPGIPGVGEVTAVKLIQEYGSFDKIIEAAPTMKGKIGEKILAGAEQGRICYELATMKTDVALPFSLNDLVYKGYDWKEVNDFARTYELRQFPTRLPVSKKKGEEEKKEIEFEERNDINGIDFGDEIGLSLDIDFSSYHTADAEESGLAIATKEKVYYFTFETLINNKELQEILKNPGVKKHVYDAKATTYVLKHHGIEINGIVNDLLLAAYLLDSTTSSNPDLVYAAFGINLDKSKDNPTLLDPHSPNLTCQMAYHALGLKSKILNGLTEVGALDLYHNIELPLAFVLSEMELEGFPLKKDDLQEIGKEFARKRDEAKEEVMRLAGEEFNPSSPKQVGVILFEKLGLPDKKKGSTAVEVLNDLLGEHPIIEKLLEYRKYAKLMSTYIDGLVPHVEGDGKIHTYFNQAQTTTGRLSSSSPNLQNISAKDEEGRLVKKAFYYDDPDVSLMSFDYGQIELRILAALSGCETYIDVFKGDRDIHTETAKRIFGTEDVTSLMRRRAKAVNFAIIYGTTSFGLAQQIGCSNKEAEQIIRSFYLAYPEIRNYLNSIIDTCTTNGFVTTMFGRKRYLRDINNPSYMVREAAKRAALNAPVQGTAADLIKIAMIKIANHLKEKGYKTKMVLQIHDELVFAVPSSEVEVIEKEIREIMTSCVKLPVKLVVEKGIGRTWFDAK
ncbi:MAG: DNA polymerase I [Bacilli bacterium]|nr:DNA polymerase I [Bacilli bacterium]